MNSDVLHDAARDVRACTLRGPHAQHEAHGVRDVIDTWPAVMP